MTDAILKRVAEAMRDKRRDLIDQPLDRIWDELAKTAIEAYILGRIETHMKAHYTNVEQQTLERESTKRRRGLFHYLFRASRREAKNRAA